MAQHHQDTPDRRPGLDLLVRELLERNPRWSIERAICEAKAEWTARHYPANPPPAPGDRA